MTFEEFAVLQMPAVLKFAAALAGQITALPGITAGPDTGPRVPPVPYKR